MAGKMLESGALSAFCGGIATMIGAGIQVDEATLMFAENQERSRFQSVCRQVYRHVMGGDPLSVAMERTGAFPAYAIDMVKAGEATGHLEEVLRNLELYYDEEDRLFAKLRSSVGYPSALLVIMSVILAFTVTFVLPVFTSVYDNMAGSLSAGSFANIGVSITIGRVALVVMVIFAVASLIIAIMAATTGGRPFVMRLLGRMPQTGRALHQLELSRFTAALATLVSSGAKEEDAMARAIEVVGNVRLRNALQQAAAGIRDVDNPRSLVQVISEYHIFEPVYARMLAVGMRSGKADLTLTQLSSTFFDDAVMQIDRAFDNIEPLLAALLTIAVGATLVAVMLPLIGIMISIG